MMTTMGSPSSSVDVEAEPGGGGEGDTRGGEGGGGEGGCLGGGGATTTGTTTPVSTATGAAETTLTPRFPEILDAFCETSAVADATMEAAVDVAFVPDEPESGIVILTMMLMLAAESARSR